MESCKLILIGCGNFGKKRLAASQNIDGVEIVAAYDTNYQAATQVCHEYGINTLERFEDISLLDYDGVIISTPNDSHLSLCQYFLEHRKYIFCESPLVKSIDQLNILTRLPESQLALISTGQPILHHPAIHELRNHLASKTLGKIYTVKISLGHNQQETRFNWKSDHAISGGGALMDLGSKVISIVNLFGKVNDYTIHSKCFSSSSSVDDYAFGHFDLTNGTLIHFETDWNKWSNTENVIVEGELGILKIPLHSSHLLLTTKDSQVVRVPLNEKNNCLENEISDFKNRIVEKDTSLEKLSKFIYLLPSILRKKS